MVKRAFPQGCNSQAIPSCGWGPVREERGREGEREREREGERERERGREGEREDIEVRRFFPVICLPFLSFFLFLFSHSLQACCFLSLSVLCAKKKLEILSRIK